MARVPDSLLRLLWRDLGGTTTEDGGASMAVVFLDGEAPSILILRHRIQSRPNLLLPRHRLPLDLLLRARPQPILLRNP